jgi:hypothetical protein
MNVIIVTTMLVVSDDDDRVLPERAIADGIYDLRDLGLSALDVRWRVLVVF